MTVVEDRPAGAGMTRANMTPERRAMIDSQLRVSGVNDPALLAAFAAVAREDFVPEARRAVAYADRQVPLGEGRTLAPALSYGQMLTAAEPRAGDKVLVVGKPGGYLAALVASLGLPVDTAAPDALAGKGPYSLVLIDGAIEEAGPALAAVLAPYGRMVTGLVERGVARLAIGRKSGEEIAFANLAEIDLAPLPEFAAPRSWSF